MEGQKLITFRLWNATVRAVVSVVGLVIIRVVVLKLPMLEDVQVSWLPLPLPDILALVAVTAIFVITYLYGRRVAQITGGLSPGAAVLGRLTEWCLALLVVVLAYVVYRPLAETLLVSQEWIYPTVFIILGVGALTGLALVIYRNLDMLTAQVVRGFSGPRGPQLGAMPCPRCGSPIPATAGFCMRCGASLAEIQQQRAIAAQGPVCAVCGSALRPDAKFCPGCGGPAPGLQAAPARPEAVAQPLGATPAVCARCGAVLPAEGKFCGVCGAPAGAPSDAVQPPPAAGPAAAVVQCTKCGATLRADAKFCPTCGAQRTWA